MIRSVQESSPPRRSSWRLMRARLRYGATFVVGGLCFFLLGIPLIPLAFLLRRLFGWQDFIHPFAKFGARLYLRTAGARVALSGLERLEPTQAYVFIANHQSNLDPPLIFCCFGRIIGALAKQELTRIPIFGQGMPLAHLIPVDRSNPKRAIASIKKGAETLRQGYSLMAFPEGTRSVDGRVKEFKKGAFFIALEAGVPVVPVVINGTRRVMGKGTGMCTPGEVQVEVLPPVSTEGYTTKNIGELVEQVRQQIIERVKVD